ncbi:uncharacterized protein MYCFIDRAFT_170480 [Pseudocercospora fijiensis CIRAD86]|uniref:Uncharacterized protein n=1 Tax=Pseudocercospora fijiensis (strain CIRAD86) TaxID=383855 RepID=N1QAK0_PSEFD|nr:uncharacterized protein MYCFIDRAFT_170480 [Pseudocercospora fijiensis CIRAD86]EME88911.1 hypothetical protein MYCFIDRAFT_170480 [Pseudocercospora fijiensis CIRAD86]
MTFGWWNSSSIDIPQATYKSTLNARAAMGGDSGASTVYCRGWALALRWWSIRSSPAHTHGLLRAVNFKPDVAQNFFSGRRTKCLQPRDEFLDIDDDKMQHHCSIPSPSLRTIDLIATAS